ncbi:MAG: hypothetical protein HY788_06850, partial [Deltaproteobacteria bacterium]|nr:hypothetical protein [Deltaproteobacteria bacterium]
QAGEFAENAHFIIEFPPEADLTDVRVNYDREIVFHLIPLTEADLSALSPETEEAVRAIAYNEILRAIQVHGVHLRRYFDLDTFDTFGLPVWFYAAENLVTPEQLEEMYPGRFRPEDSEGILWDRNLKPMK